MLHFRYSLILCCSVVLVFETHIKAEKTHYCERYSKYRDNIVRVYNFRTNTGTIITRLNRTTGYGYNLECKWRIVTRTHKRIKLTIVKASLDTVPDDEPCDQYDHLSINDGISKWSKHLGDICVKQDHYPKEIISSDYAILLTFQSDDVGDASNTFQKGFEIRYELFEPATSRCPPGWLEGPEDPHSTWICYYIVTFPTRGLDFETAQDYCGFSQANLAKIDTAEKFSLLQGYARDIGLVYTLWIGLTDIEEEGHLKWLDSNDLDQTFSFPRYSVRNNSEGSNCAILNLQSRSVVMTSCKERHYSVCETNLFLVDHVPNFRVPTKKPVDNKGSTEDTTEADKTGLIVGSVAGVLGFFLCCGLCYCCCCRSNDKDDNTASVQAAQDTEASRPCIPQPEVIQPSAPPLTEFLPLPESDRGAPPTYSEAMDLMVASGNSPRHSFHEEKYAPSYS